MLSTFYRVLLVVLAIGVNWLTAFAGEASPETVLAAKVREIAGSATLSRDEQGKAVAVAVRAAIGAAIEGISSDDQIVAVALRFAAKAAAAAPQFSPVIVRVVSEIPAIAKVKGAVDKIAAAVRAAVKSARPGNPEFGGDLDDVVVSPSR